MAYDIADSKRLRRVHVTMRRFGYSLQYSLFICDLEPQELTKLRWELGEIIRHTEDKVALVDLGDAPSTARFEFLGVRPVLPSSGATII